jgi:hypothetical protein
MAILIDVHSTGQKPDQHDTYASHVSRRTPGVRFLRVVPVRGNLLQAINIVGWILLLPRKMASDITLNPAKWSAGLPPSFSPNIAIKVVMKAKHLSTVGY